MNQQNNTIVTPEFRCNYPSLLTPKEDLTGQLKYSIEAVFYDATQLADMRKMCNFVVQQTWPQGPPPGLKSPFKSGDESNIEEYHGKIFCRFRSNYAVRVVDQNKQLITDETLLYPGMWGRAVVVCRTYNRPESKGVSFYLQAFQKLRDDEPAFAVPAEQLFPDDQAPPDGALNPWGSDQLPF